jgi:hypothetical protein
MRADGLAAFASRAAGRLARHVERALSMPPFLGAAAPDGPRPQLGWTADARSRSGAQRRDPTRSGST